MRPFYLYIARAIADPAKPVRLMLSLLNLTHVRNVSDEAVVERWSKNSYSQYFCGENSFIHNVPRNASELIHFRKRIGWSYIELIFKESIRMNEEDGDDDDVNINITVQEKNIIYLPDAKLHKKIIRKCQPIAQEEQLPVR